MKKWLLEKKWRIVISGTLIVTVPMICLAMFVYIFISGHLKNIINEENRQAALNIAAHIESELQSDIRNGGLLTSRLLLKEAVRQRDRKKITRHLKDFVDIVSSVERAFVADKKGILIANHSEDRALIGKSFSYRDWYQGVSRKWEPYVSEFYLRASQPQKNLFAIALPIRDVDNSVIGILVLQASENYIQDAIGHIPAPKNQKVYVIDKKGDLIYHPDYRVDRIIDFTGFSSVRKVMNGKSGVETVKNPDGAAMLTAYQPVKQWGWGVIVQRPEQEVYASLRKLTYGLFSFTVVMIAIGAFLAYGRSETLFFLKKLSGELEIRVEERTAELTSAMESLRSEMDSRRHANEALNESEKRYRDLIEHASDVIFTLSTDGVFLSLNPSFETVFGWPRTEWLDKPFDLIVHPGDLPLALDRFQTALRGEQQPIFELRLLSNSERDIICELSVTPQIRDGQVLSLMGIARDITDRKKAENMLQESEEKYRRLVDTSLVSIYKTTMSGDIIYVNKAMANIFEFDSPEEMKVPGASKRYKKPEDRERLIEMLRKNGKVEHIDLELLTRTGKTKEVIMSAVMDGDTISGMLMDVTERRHAEKALQMSEKKYRTLTESLKDLVYRADPETLTGTFVNRAVEEIYGYSVEEWVNNPGLWGKTIHNDDKERVLLHFTDAQRQGRDSSIDYRIIRKDGTERWVSDRFTWERDEHGRILSLNGILSDITERKQKDLFIDNIFESMGEGLVVVDPQYRILTANKEYCRQADERLEEIIGRYCYEVSHHSDRHCAEGGIECAPYHAFQTGRPHAVVHEHRDKKGAPTYLEIKSYPIKDESGEVRSVIEIITDITEKRKLEAQYLHAQKMESIGTLAGGVAHDFNNILSAVIGYGHVALMKMAKDDPQRLNIEHMLEAADRAADLAKQLLLFSRKQVSQRKPVDLNDVIGRVEKFLKRVIGEDIICKKAGTDQPLTIFADSHQLEQVLMNLATNARDAMPGGGVFTILTEQINLNEDFTRAHGYGKPGAYAMITISDTGMGMDEATQNRIFEPFFTTKEVGKGTGLGLSVVYGIIKQHEGFINVYSEPEKGTTFRIYLPLIAPEAAGEAETHQEEAPARGTETVLLAEDDDSLRMLSRAALAEYGYTVIVAVDGADAVGKFMENRDTIHLLLFDLIMPKMNGKEAYDEIRKIKPDMKVIFVSGYAPDLVQQKVLLEDGAYLIFKPLSPVELLRKVRSVLDGAL